MLEMILILKFDDKNHPILNSDYKYDDKNHSVLDNNASI